jgi:nucleotide-binding universal stress UspA family protein
MALKEILVHLDHTPGCHARLDVAISLAHKHQAHLTGLYATESTYHSPYRPNAGPEVKTETLFHERAARAGVAAVWLSGTAEESLVEVSERVILQAYYADLVVVGQTEISSGHPFNPEQVALGSGRPVLIVPNKGEFKTVGERIMVAWRRGKASSRAVNDALPLLKLARQVNVVRVNPQGGDFENDVVNLQTYLERHGIHSLADKLRSDDIRVGDLLLNQACDLGADLVVMGIFPSGRIGTAGSGPVARYFLEHMTIPVLMSG